MFRVRGFIDAPPGSAFLRRLLDLTAGVTRPHHHIRFNTEAKNDIRTWLQFLGNFNGLAFFLSERWDTSLTLELYTDAAVSKGYGAIFGKHWFYGPFTIAWHSLNISFLELFPITSRGPYLGGHHGKQLRLIFH